MFKIGAITAGGTILLLSILETACGGGSPPSAPVPSADLDHRFDPFISMENCTISDYRQMQCIFRNKMEVPFDLCNLHANYYDISGVKLGQFLICGTVNVHGATRAFLGIAPSDTIHVVVD